MEKACIKVVKGSGFFAAPEYIVTCHHVVKEYQIGDKVTCYQCGGEPLKAKIEEINEQLDLALLKADKKQGEYLALDRGEMPGSSAGVFGFPKVRGAKKYCQENTFGLVIGEINENGYYPLNHAGAAMRGYSGGPVLAYHSENMDERWTVGIFSDIFINESGPRGANAAWCIPAGKALDLWGDLLCERHYTVSVGRSQINPFDYSGQTTEFIDSNGNLERLRNFMKDDSPVLWLPVIGPGGAGKSRLAYELAREQTSEWVCRSVLLDQLRTGTLQKIYDLAGHSLLLIVDYAYSGTGELGAWLAQLDQLKLKRKVRVLLLQRQGRDSNGRYVWEEEFTRNDPNVYRLRYLDELSITPDRELAEKVMRSYIRNRKGNPDDYDYGKLCDTLQSCDPDQFRPLFAMFIAEAAMLGESPERWKPIKVIAYLYSRELRDLLPKGVGIDETHAAKFLWVLATLCGSLDLKINTLRKLDLPEYCQELDAAKSLSSLCLRFPALMRDIRTHRMKPFKPDLLGEFFVRDYFGDNPTEIRQILRIAFDLSPEASKSFLTRLFTDYEMSWETASACCMDDILQQSAVSEGLVMRPNAELLLRFAKQYDTREWWGSYARGLAKHIAEPYVTPADVHTRLKTLRKLYQDKKHHSNELVVEGYASGLAEKNDKWLACDERASKALMEYRERLESTERDREHCDAMRQIDRSAAEFYKNWLFGKAFAEAALERLDREYSERADCGEPAAQLCRKLVQIFRESCGWIADQAELEASLQHLKDVVSGFPGNINLVNIYKNEEIACRNSLEHIKNYVAAYYA